MLCLLGLATLFALLRAADRTLPRVRLLPRGWWRPRPVDAVVTALLAVWWVVGSGTVDDGYIAGIVRSRGDNGFVGNVYRWLNAPEAPFSWFSEPYHWWSLISAATPWMRLPSALLGLLCWFLVSRLLLPRLGRAGRLRGTPWIAALAFGTWFVPLDLGLRPEPWVAVGTVLAFLAVERAVATRRVLPLAVALTVAGATTALTPGGLMAVAPVLAAAVPLLRGLRARTDLHLRGRVARRACSSPPCSRPRRPRCCSWPPTRERPRSPRPCGCGAGSAAGGPGTRSSSGTRCCWPRTTCRARSGGAPPCWSPCWPSPGWRGCSPVGSAPASPRARPVGCS